MYICTWSVDSDHVHGSYSWTVADGVDIVGVPDADANGR